MDSSIFFFPSAGSSAILNKNPFGCCRKGRTGMADRNRIRTTAYRLAQGGIIAALYVALTLIFEPISFGPMQIRIAEILTILPMFTPAAIPGLFIGCFLANLLGGAIPWDIAFGSIATLIGAALGYLLRRNRWLVPVPAILANTAIVPFILFYGYGIQDTPLILLFIYLFAGEVLGCYVLGELLASVLIRRPALFRIFRGGRSENK